MDPQPPILNYTTQPPGFRLRFETHAAGITFIDQPAHRLGREASGVIGMAVAMILIAGMSVLATIKGEGAPWYIQFGLLAFVCPFVAGLLIVRVRVGRAPVTLGTENDILFLITPTALGPKRRQWNRQEIRAVKVRLSMLLIQLQPNHQWWWVREVQVFPGQRSQDLRWIADQINRALRLQVESDSG